MVLYLLIASSAHADTLTYDISGIPEPLLGNVRSHVEQFSLTGSARISARRFSQISENAERRAREALKPFGYYHPEIVSSLTQTGPEDWRLRLRVQTGSPILISEARIDIRGAGKDDGGLREWRRDWPLGSGRVLDQRKWEQEKRAALEITETSGYLKAEFVEHDIVIDLAQKKARLTLVLDTGPQVMFGELRYTQDVVEPWVLRRIPRFAPGTPYNTELLAQYRLDLWRSGNFTDIEVREERQLDRSPPVVDLHARLETKTRNTWQGALGFGTDTGVRLQALYSRHPLSSRGDRLDVGTGYREIDDEFSIRADYRIPRRSAKRQFWTATTILRSENQDLEFKRSASDEGFIKLANGQVEDLEAKVGRLHVRDRKEGFQQVFETVYAQFVRESFQYLPGINAPPEAIDAANDPAFAGLFRNTISSLALGIEWDLPTIRGKAFETEGHRERAWLFTANKAWGSARDFTQAYLSTHRSYLFNERFKFLLRAELGYSDAEVRELSLDIGGEPLLLSVSQLPDTYRFKAGGSSSVRGYGFEELSNNDIGSNNIVTASAELEMKIANNWSVAAFADIGNAFNDWDEAELLKGAGLGVRWYSIAGAVRVDVAQALDLDGKPWRIHFTIGSPLL
jgi:translocation and assembly module TamA